VSVAAVCYYQDMNQLEIGPGDKKLGDDWLTVSCVPGPSVDVVAQWGEESLPFQDNQFELVYASHVLEHVWWHKTHDALREVFRILRRGGIFEVWVPDFAIIVNAYRTRTCGDWLRFNPEGDFMKYVNGRIFTYGPGEVNTHRAVFDAEYLRRCLERAGFGDIEKITQPRQPGHRDINLGLKGRKR
jgi:predicted SAM-dependent methyltransferase